MSRLLTQCGLLGKTRLWVLSLGLCAAVALPAPARALSDADIAVYKQAFAQLDSNPTAALTTARRAKDSLLNSVLQWQVMTKAESPFAFSSYASALKDCPDWPGQTAMRKEAERRIGADVSSNTVLAFFSENAPLTFNGASQYARALNETGNAAKAATVLQTFWRNGDMTSSEQVEFLSTYRKQLVSGDIKARADNLLWNSNTDQAENLLPYLQSGEQAVIRARLALQGKGNADTAVAAVPAANSGEPGLVFDRALWRSKADNLPGTAELLKNVRSEGPLPNRWWKLRDDTARQLAERGDAATAYRIASQHSIPATAGVPYTELEWLAGWIALSRQSKPDPTTALVHFSNVYNVGVSVNTRSKGAYWAGRAEDAAGHKDRAESWYKNATRYGNTFYGQLAAIELYNEVTVAAPSDTKADSATRRAFDAHKTVKAIRQLEAIGQRSLAFRYARSMLESVNNAQEFALMAELGTELKRPELSSFAGKIGGRKGYTLGRTAYPVLDSRYRSLGDQIGWTFTHAIIWQESGFNPEAKSGVGAEGLMQLMPATARQEEKRVGVGKGSLSNPQHNLTLGTSHMRSLLDRFDGYMPQAIAGYNAGGSRPVQWEDRFGQPGCANDDIGAMRHAVNWIESIPFPETRDYVKYVLGAEQVYRAILSKDATPLTLPARLKGSCPQMAARE